MSILDTLPAERADRSEGFLVTLAAAFEMACADRQTSESWLFHAFAESSGALTVEWFASKTTRVLFTLEAENLISWFAIAVGGAVIDGHVPMQASEDAAEAIESMRSVIARALDFQQEADA